MKKILTITFLSMLLFSCSVTNKNHWKEVDKHYHEWKPIGNGWLKDKSGAIVYVGSDYYAYKNYYMWLVF